MSIYSIKSINLQFYRRAFLLASSRLNSVFAQAIREEKVFKREFHNSLSQTEQYRLKISNNAEVLKAVNCSVSHKDLKPQLVKYANNSNRETGDCKVKKLTNETSRCKLPNKDNGGSGKNDKLKTILYALAAALGLGGIILYFMSKNLKQDDKLQPTLPTTPTKSNDLPQHVPYLLIGSGTAAFSAFRAIKSNDAKAKVLMITDEYRKPYMRPPLSKELWYSAQDKKLADDYRFKQWTGAERSLYFEPNEFFIEPSKLIASENGGIAVAHGFKVKKIDPHKQKVILNDGFEISYDECLIATGCRPKNLQVFSDAPPSVQDKIMVYRTPDDFERLKGYADSKKNIVIIGNGFLGSELACSLANYTKANGGRIFQIFPEKANMSKILPDYLSKWTMEKVELQGVCVLPNTSIKNVSRDKSSLKLNLSTGDTVITDVVVLCIGCEANTDIANLSGLEVDNRVGGFVVNAELEARRHLFVAGDASNFYDPLLGRRRVEHHDHSVISGRLAGENMVGKKKPYNHQSMFWSDLGPEIGYEGIGLVDSSLPTVGVFSLPSKADRNTDNLSESIQPQQGKIEKVSNSADIICSDDKSVNYGRGVVFYLKDEKVVGILLWNIFNRIGLARTIINQNKKYDDLNEVAKLFDIHS